MRSRKGKQTLPAAQQDHPRDKLGDGDGLDVDDVDSDGGEIPVHGVELLLDPLGHGEPVEHLCKRLLASSHQGDHVVHGSGPVLQQLYRRIFFEMGNFIS